MKFQPASVQEVVSRLTQDSRFRQFYFDYLMAETGPAREAIAASFLASIEKMPTDQQAAMKAEFSRCFLQMPKMVNDLHERVREASVAMAGN